MADCKAAFDVIRSKFTSSNRPGCIANLPQLVLFAEKILEERLNGVDAVHVAMEAIQLYLSMDPPTNQFLIRAYLSLAIVHKPDSPAESNKLQDCLKYISKAVSIARKTNCYRFLVYNSSVILWRVTRPFHVPQYYSVLTNCVQNVVKALEEIQYKDDYEWRLQLMRLLMKCLMANYQRDDAIRVEQSALHMARKHAPHMLMPVFKQMALDGVGDVKLIEKETKRNPHILVLAKVWKLQSAMFKRPMTSVDAETKLLRLLSMVTEKEATPTPIPSSNVLSLILIEIGELSMNYSLHHITESCIDKIQSVEDLELLIRLELLKIQLTINKLPSGDDDRLLYTRHAIKQRSLCTEKCYDLFVRCIREDKLEEVERISVVLWNISLPLLQPSLSHNVVKSFTLATDLLEKTNSLMYGIRMMLHFELAKVLYSQDKAQTASDHIDKAMCLDHQESNKDHYQHFKHCLNMKHNLYTDQEKELDKAVSMIEQIKSSDFDKDGLKQLLISVVDLMDPPNNFSNTLNHLTIINPSKDNITEQDLMMYKLSEKSVQYTEYKERAESFHKATINGYNNPLKLLILSDISRLARKHHIWDVALLSSLYCTQSDDGHWTARAFTPSMPVSKDSSKLKVIGRGSSDGFSSTSLRTPDHTLSVSIRTPDHTLSTLSSPLSSLPLPYSYSEINTEKLQLVALAEVFCILGECLVQTLRDEGLQLGGVVTRPEGVPEDNQQWLNYSEWIQTLSVDAHKSFIRCAELGSTLYEPWLITNAVVYMWNYNMHNFQRRQWKGLVDPLRGLLQTLKGQSNSTRDNALISRVTGILANGLIQSTDPKPKDYSSTATSEQSTKKGCGGNRTGSRGSGRLKKKREGSGRNMVAQDSLAILKEAVEICEFAAGECFADAPLNICRIVLEALVTAKQLLQQPVNMKILNNTDKSVNNQEEVWLSHYQAIINTEMHHVMTKYGMYDFPNSPSIKEVYDAISECDWKDNGVLELELLTILAHSAHMRHLHDEVVTCCEKVLKAKYMSSAKFQSICNSLYGQSLVLASGKSNRSVTVIKRAIDCFNDSIRLGGDTCAYDDVIKNCKHAWNTIILLDTPTDRAGLKDSALNILINVLKRTERNDENQAIISDDDNHLLMKMVAAVMDMYNTNKEDWSQGIEALDTVLRVSPKQYLRLLYERKMILKCKLGRAIDGDMLRFQEEPPAVMASLWFSCAQESTNQNQQYTAYQNAIKCLQKSKDSKPRLLVEYITRFTIWLQSHQYPSNIIITHLEWAIHELLKDNAHLNVSDLNQLLILHIMMSMASEDYHKWTYLRKSVGYCLGIWKELLCNKNKQQQSNECPGTMREWMCFIPSNEMFEQISTQNDLSPDDEAVDASIPSIHTVTHPELVLYYLDHLYTGLYLTGDYLMILPILFYQRLISSAITNDKILTQLTAMRLSIILGALVDEDTTLSHDYFNKATNEGFLLPDNIIRMNDHVTCHMTGDAELAQKTWLKIIDLLISQGQFSMSRDMLHTIEECNICEMLQTTVKLLNLKLAAMEGQYEPCMNTLCNIESNSVCTLEDWTILLDTVYHIAIMDNQCKAKVKAFLLSIMKNRSCDTSLMSCDRRYLTSLVHFRLLQILDNLDTKLEEEVLSNFQHLNKLGCYQTVCIQLLLSLVKLKLSRTDSLAVISDTNLIRSVEYSKKAIDIAQSVILCTGSAHMTDSPLYKLLTRCQLVYCQSLLIVYEQYVKEEKRSVANQQNKPSIIKLIDQFTAEDSSFSDEQQKLKSIQCIAADEGITLLSGVLHMTTNKLIKTECLLYIGLFFYYVSLNASPDKPLQWATPPSPDQEKLYSTLSQIMRKKQADGDSVKEQCGVAGLISCTNTLMECVMVGLAHKQLDIVMKASLVLVEVYGTCEPLLATSYLALYQSCSISRYCRDLLMKVLVHSSSSRLSSLLNQETVLKSCDSHMTVAAENNRNDLQTDYQAYKRLEVSVKHLELLNHVHCDTRIVILQHSHDQDKLYAGYLVPPQPPVVIKKGQPLSDKAPGPIPSVTCVDACFTDLQALKELMSQYRTDVKASIQNPESENEEMIQSSFHSIVDGLESYLEEASKLLSDCLSKEDPSKELTVILLVDVHLMEFPIEALQFLQQFKKNIVGISRDLSLQMLTYRMLSMKESGEPGSEEDGKKTKTDKYQAQADSFVVNSSAVKYVLDPRQDLKLKDGIKKVIQDFSKITAKWSGSSGYISSSDWSTAFTSCTSMIVVCSENLLSHFTPSQLASTNIPNCSMAIIEDQIRTNASFHIQSKLDVSKSSDEELRQEANLVAMVLLSLAGVNSIVMNQWYCSLNDGASSAETNLKKMLSSSLRIGQIHWQPSPQADSNDEGTNMSMTYQTFIKLVYGLPHLTLI